jgi:hypothetical protein
MIVWAIVLRGLGEREIQKIVQKEEREKAQPFQILKSCWVLLENLQWLFSFLNCCKQCQKGPRGKRKKKKKKKKEEKEEKESN